MARRYLIVVVCLLSFIVPATLRAEEERWFTSLYYGLHSPDTVGTALHSFHTDSNRYIGVGLGRVFVKNKYISFEGEGIFAEHFGGFGGYEEFIAALILRYHYFPWDRYLRTTVALCDGPSFATRNIDNEDGYLMNFLSVELTFSLPAVKRFALVAKFHHRSGAEKVLHIAKGESNFYTFGLRYRF